MVETKRGYQLFLHLWSGNYRFKHQIYDSHRDAEFALIDMMSNDCHVIGGDIIDAVDHTADFLVKPNPKVFGTMVDHSQPIVFDPDFDHFVDHVNDNEDFPKESA